MKEHKENLIMKANTRKLVAILMGCSLAAPITWAQGSLTPTGAPDPTMKTLMQVEPRTPISGVPYSITESGSYYLTTNLASTGHGIVIKTSRVTVDLMGFAITGDGGASDYGIYMFGATNATLRDVVVRGGAVSGFGVGVCCEYAQNNRIESLAISDNSDSGVTLNGSSVGGQCNGNTVCDCTFSFNQFAGVFLNGMNGQCEGNMVRDCAISGAGSYGVYLLGNAGQCGGNTVRDCTVIGNINGITLYAYNGQSHGNTVTHCVLRNNSGSGIYIEYANGNRVENNHVSGTNAVSSYGIKALSSSANLILQNTCVGRDANNYFFNASTNTYGPIVTNSGALSASGDSAHPWANFSR